MFPLSLGFCLRDPGPETGAERGDRCQRGESRPRGHGGHQQRPGGPARTAGEPPQRTSGPVCHSGRVLQLGVVWSVLWENSIVHNSSLSFELFCHPYV